MHRLPVSALIAAVCFAAGCGAGSAAPVGLWLAKDGGKIRISPCGQYLCGVLVQPGQAIDPATGKPPTDVHNSDPARRSRPLAGIEILISMRRDGPNKWTGHVYNDDDGKIYPGSLIEKDASSIRIEGCWLGVCGGEDLTRLK